MQLGVQVVDGTNYGAKVVKVLTRDKYDVGHRLGIRPGDVITTVNGKKIESADMLRRTVSASGGRLDVKWWTPGGKYYRARAEFVVSTPIGGAKTQEIAVSPKKEVGVDGTPIK